MADPDTPERDLTDAPTSAGNNARRGAGSPRTAGWGWAVFFALAFAAVVLVAAGTNRSVMEAIGPDATQALRGLAGLAAVIGCGSLAMAKGRSAAWGLTALACYLGLVIVPFLPPVSRREATDG